MHHKQQSLYQKLFSILEVDKETVNIADTSIGMFGRKEMKAIASRVS